MMRNKTIMMVAALAAFSFGSASLRAQKKAPPKKTVPASQATAPAAPAPDAKPAAPAPAAPAPAAAAEKPPIAASAEFVKGFDQLDSLLALIDQIETEQGLKQMRSRAQNMADGLRAELPSGYTYDPGKHAFVAAPTSAPAPDKKQ